MAGTIIQNSTELTHDSQYKIFYEDKNQFLEKPSDKSKVHACSTCKKNIDSEISRVVIMRDQDGGPRLMQFHFFFPCWDFEQLCQEYSTLTIDKAGFVIPEDISINQDSLLDLKKNLSFWV